MKAKVFEHRDLDPVRLDFGAMGLGGLFGGFEGDVLFAGVLHALEKGLSFIDS